MIWCEGVLENNSSLAICEATSDPSLHTVEKSQIPIEFPQMDKSKRDTFF